MEAEIRDLFVIGPVHDVAIFFDVVIKSVGIFSAKAVGWSLHRADLMN